MENSVKAVEPVPVEKKRSNLFQKGKSGNPNGRPKGSKNKITLMRLQLEGELRTQIGKQMVEVVQKGLDMAKEGNEAMIKLFVDKCVSTVKLEDDSDSGQEKIQIVIGRLPEREPITINGESVEVE